MDVLRNLSPAGFRFWKFEARNVSCRECFCGEESAWRCVACFAPQFNGDDEVLNWRSRSSGLVDSVGDGDGRAGTREAVDNFWRHAARPF